MLDEHLMPLHLKSSRRRYLENGPIESRANMVMAPPALDMLDLSRAQLAAGVRAFTICKIDVDGLPSLLLLLPERFEVPDMPFSLHGAGQVRLSGRLTCVHRAVDADMIVSTTKTLFQQILGRRLPGLMSDDYYLPFYILPDNEDCGTGGWLKTCGDRVPFYDFDFGNEPREYTVFFDRQPVPYFYKHSDTAGSDDMSVSATRLTRALKFTEDAPPYQQPQMHELSKEKCALSRLPPDYARMFSFLPTITYLLHLRLRSDAAQASILHPLGLDSALVATALLAPTVGPCNYQRLEYIGDAALKFMAYLTMFSTHPKLPEGALSALADRLINNARLQRSALNLGLAQYISTEAFSTKSWTLESQGLASERQISTKILADVVEALLGVAFVEDRFGAVSLNKTTETLRLFLPEVQWLDPTDAVARSLPAASSMGFDHTRARVVEDLIGYRFNTPLLLFEALNHSSPDTNVRSMDRLEFLGDAVIDLLIKRCLYASPHNFNEARMTLARHALANKETFAYLTTLNGTEVRDSSIDVDLRTKNVSVSTTTNFKPLHDHMVRTPSQDLANQRLALLQHYEEVKERIESALATGDRWPWADMLHLASPKWASDLLESIVGGVFVDSGANLSTCEGVLDILGLMTLVHRAATDTNWEFRQSKALLHETVSAKGLFASEPYKDTETSRVYWKCEVKIDEAVIAAVQGMSCRAEAEERAAEIALEKLRRDPDRPPSTGAPKRKRFQDSAEQDSAKKDSGMGVTDSEDDESGQMSFTIEPDI
jgi:dsRNA-specific ribonuclease